MSLRILIFLCLLCCIQCTTTSQNYTMQAPDKKPPILSLERGLSDMESTVILEKYTQTYSGNAVGIKVCENGDAYKVYLSSNGSIKDESVTWKKVTQLDAGDINKLKDFYQDYVLDYNKNPSQKVLNKPLSSNYWYFYLDNEVFAYSQEQRFRRSPKFARKIDKIFRKF